MKKNIHIITVGILFFIFFTSVPLFPQQITRFAVVDFNRILAALNIKSNAFADLEKKSAQIQAELDKRKKEIEDMYARVDEMIKTQTPESSAENAENPGGGDARNNALKKQHQTELNRLKSEIIKKTEALKDYHQKKLAELEGDKNRLNSTAATPETLKQINTQIELTAESEGYTMVLDKNTRGIIWYSRSVDITDKVISNLTSKLKR
ncbi:MAG: OmpH family outer membrane protein [Spirochaetaceae bacterium]|jgi:outer membrane protein|nr:OmpH family outer membrane protein [Spirochaetaceae bacterium]